MPLARTYSVALIGVTGHVVEIEADIANGLPAVIVVGLPDTALREARDLRVPRTCATWADTAGRRPVPRPGAWRVGLGLGVRGSRFMARS